VLVRAGIAPEDVFAVGMKYQEFCDALLEIAQRRAGAGVELCDAMSELGEAIASASPLDE